MGSKTEFIVVYETDSGTRSFVEFDLWEEAYKWCEGAISTGTKVCHIHWINKTETLRVQHLRKMVWEP